MDRLYFDDFAPGDEWDLGSYEMTRDEMVLFASRYDPQPVHMSDAKAGESTDGTVIASVWHTASVYIRLLTERFLRHTSHVVGKRVTDLRWPEQVRPGDTLSGRVEIVGTTPSDSDRNRGYVDYRIVGGNQRDDTVLTMDLHGIFERRSPVEPV